MATQLTKTRLLQQYGKCIGFANDLSSSLQELGKIATSIYGEELYADMCNGNEIEFRKLDKNGFIDADSTILIEDLIEKINS